MLKHRIKAIRLLLRSAHIKCSVLNQTLSIATVRIYICGAIITITTTATVYRIKKSTKTSQLNSILILVSHTSVPLTLGKSSKVHKPCHPK